MRALLLAAVMTACVGSLPACAQADPAAEIAFWTAAAQDDDAASYRAYLDAFPHGRFAALARLRLARTLGPVAPAGVPTPAGADAAPLPAVAGTWVRVARAQVRRIDGITVDMDASALRAGSNWRLAVVPAGSSDGPPADERGFLADSTPVSPDRMHLTLPPSRPGSDEVRLYWIPRFADTYAVAARTPVTVQPGAAGATLMRDLAREATRLGPIRFEAMHRDQPMLIEAAFLRVRPETEWNAAWFQGTLVSLSRPAAVIGVGQVGAVPDASGSLGEGLCMLPTDGAMLGRIARLQTGDAVLLRAVPTSWSSAGRGSPVVLDRCELAD